MAVISASVHAVNVSRGGVPKRPVPRAFVRWEGLEGDAQRDRRHHGGPDRAVTLYSLELIQALQAEGHPITTGSIGENLTLAGVDWSALGAGVQIEAGKVLLELTKPASPCQKISGSFAHGDFTRVAEPSHPGWSRWCARVVQEGLVAVGDPVAVVAR